MLSIYFKKILNSYAKMDSKGNYPNKISKEDAIALKKEIFQILKSIDSKKRLKYCQYSIKGGTDETDGFKIYIYDERYCYPKFTKGIYMLYSFSNDGSSFKLSINQGTKFPSQNIKEDIAKDFRKLDIDSLKGFRKKNRFYEGQHDVLISKEYTKNVKEEVLVSDFKKMYATYVIYNHQYFNELKKRGFEIKTLDGEIKSDDFKIEKGAKNKIKKNDMKIKEKNNETKNRLSDYFKKIIDSYNKGKYGDLSQDDEDKLKNEILSILKTIDHSKMKKEPYQRFPHEGIRIFIQNEIERPNRIRIYIGHEKCNNFSINDGLFLLYTFSEDALSIRLSLSIGDKSINLDDRAKIGKALDVVAPVGFLKRRGKGYGDAILRIGYGANNLMDVWLERDLKNLYYLYLGHIDQFNVLSNKKLNKKPINNENKLFKYFMDILNNEKLSNNVKNDIIKTIFDILNSSKSFPSLTNHLQVHIQEGIKNKRNWLKIYIWDNRYFDSTFDQGIYLMYFFNGNGNTFSLYIGQGKNFPSADIRESIANEFRYDIIDRRKYGKNISEVDLVRFVEKGAQKFVIAYTHYKKGSFNDELLQKDLKIFYNLYKELYVSYKLKLDELNNIKLDESNNVIFHKYLIGKGYFFDKKTIENYLLSLKVKSFAILTGNSGTGKTKLSQLFSEYLECGGRDNHIIVPVGANWTENRNVVGYYNVLTKEYQHTPSLDLILKAQKHSDEPYFLILDEMNLSHVERYFSDFLSSMESGKPIPLHKAEDVEDVPNELIIPPNVFIVGTVNVDETTYMFSPKVLDRANVIEFKTFDDISMMDYVKMISPEMEFDGDVDYLENPLSDRRLRENILSVVNGHFSDIKCNVSEIIENDYGVAEVKVVESTVLLEISMELTKFNSYLVGSGFEFGYRTINEILAFMYVAWKYEGEQELWDNWRRYFDAQILQKILPKLHGSQMVLGETLDNLLAHCLSVDSVDEIDDLSKLNLDELNAPYLESAKKLIQMKNVLEKQRYVSFIN